MVPIRIQHTLACHHTLIGEVGDEHAGTVETTSVIPVCEFVDHHPLKYVRLIVDVVECVFPERIQNFRRHHESVDTHP